MQSFLFGGCDVIEPTPELARGFGLTHEGGPVYFSLSSSNGGQPRKIKAAAAAGPCASATPASSLVQSYGIEEERTRLHILSLHSLLQELMELSPWSRNANKSSGTGQALAAVYDTVAGLVAAMNEQQHQAPRQVAAQLVRAVTLADLRATHRFKGSSDDAINRRCKALVVEMEEIYDVLQGEQQQQLLLEECDNMCLAYES